MTRKSLANTMYLECLAFTATALLAVSDVEANAGRDDQTQDADGTVKGAAADYNNGSICYNSK